MHAPRRGLELRVPPLALVLLAALGIWAVDRALPGWRLPTWPALRAAAVALAVLGVLLALLGVAAFRRARTTVDPRHPDRSQQVVAHGVYSLTRNPMYLGMSLLLLAFVFWRAQPLGLALVAAFVAWIDRWQIVPEERALRARFGPAFDDYARRVRRWL